jgi:lipoyl(octanoyl) transferase
MAEICEIRGLGLVDYAAAWELQNQLAAQVAVGACPPVLLLLEHPHTYTLGRMTKDEHLLWDADELAQKGIALHRVDRGGDITYHGPGQLVGYPILRLAPIGWQGQRLPQADFVGYLRKIEEMLILALAHFGVPARRVEGHTGVWVADAEPAPGDPYRAGKIASIGVKVDARGVTRHGFALNVASDPAYWQGIVACGLDGVRMLNLAELVSPAPSMKAVTEVVIHAFAQVFGYALDVSHKP